MRFWALKKVVVSFELIANGARSYKPIVTESKCQIAYVACGTVVSLSITYQLQAASKSEL